LTVWTNTLLNLLHHYGVPDKVVNKCRKSYIMVSTSEQTGLKINKRKTKIHRFNTHHCSQRRTPSSWKCPSHILEVLSTSYVELKLMRERKSQTSISSAAYDPEEVEGILSLIVINNLYEDTKYKFKFIKIMAERGIQQGGNEIEDSNFPH
jgi:hypothetical protein